MHVKERVGADKARTEIKAPCSGGDHMPGAPSLTAGL